MLSYILGALVLWIVGFLSSCTMKPFCLDAVGQALSKYRTTDMWEVLVVSEHMLKTAR